MQTVTTRRIPFRPGIHGVQGVASSNLVALARGQWDQMMALSPALKSLMLRIRRDDATTDRVATAGGRAESPPTLPGDRTE
jgi:hypothetical protein